jgi:hypothetical protein
MSDLYSNWIPHLFGLIMILLLCLPTFYLDRIALRFQTHRLIHPKRVRSIQYHTPTGESISLPQEQFKNLINWYNQSTFIQRRPSSESIDETASFLQIILDNGEAIRIFLSNTDIEIERTTRKSSVRYWAKHPQLQEYLQNH